MPNPSGYRVESNTCCQKCSLQFVVTIVHKTEIIVTFSLAFQKSDSGFFRTNHFSVNTCPSILFHLFYSSFILSEKSFPFPSIFALPRGYFFTFQIDSCPLFALLFSHQSRYLNSLSNFITKAFKCVRQSTIRLSSMREQLFSLDCTLKVKSSYALKIIKLNY